MDVRHTTTTADLPQTGRREAAEGNRLNDQPKRMKELHPSHDESSSAAAAPNRTLLQQPSQPSSPPPPPPITLNPPSQEATDSFLAQSNPSRPTPIPRSVFSSLRPPRSSSLLSSSASGPRSPSPVPGGASYTAHRDNARPPVSLKRPSTPSSQTEKAGIPGLSGLSPREGSRARNRWSTSTVSSTSSRTSPFVTRRTGVSPNRRASLEVTALRGSPPSARQSPHKYYQDRLPPMYANRSASVAAGANMGSLDVSQHSMRYHGANRQRGISPSPSRSKALPELRMPYDQGHNRYLPRGHSRERSGKGSHDLGKDRAPKPPSQKAMLSRALQKANTAVQLDNAQNFEGARQAYSEACNLLHQVLQRTTADEDKRKLEAIRQTYTSRIEELDQMGPWQDDTVKALPARPESDEYNHDGYSYHYHEADAEPSRVDTIRQMSITGGESSGSYGHYSRMTTQPRHQMNGYTRDASAERRRPSHTPDHGLLQSSFSRAPSRLRSREDLNRQPNNNLAPAPLASLRSISPVRTHADDVYDAAILDTSNVIGDSQAKNQSNEAAANAQEGGQNSWLDPIDESGDSACSSVHSRTSSLGYRRRHIRAASGNTETEFDTALDAAIEAAYNEGYEPMEPEDYSTVDTSEEAVMSVLRKVELARERVRQTEREAHNDMENLRKAQAQQQEREPMTAEFYEDDSSEEEERILEEITRDFAIEDFTMGQQLKPVKGNWRNVLDTNYISDFHPLSPLSEVSPLSERPLMSSLLSQAALPIIPPPTQSLPQLPPLAPSSPVRGVHKRQPSGQNMKQLKIETTNLEPLKLEPPKPMESEETSKRESSSTADKSERPSVEESAQATTVDGKSPSPPATEMSPSEAPIIGSPPHKKAADTDDNSIAVPASPSVSRLRKNFSSSSLRSMKSRNMSLSNLDEGSDMSPGTPSSNTFSRMPAVPALPAPLAAAFKDQIEIASAGGLHLFDDNFHQPSTPGLPNPVSSDAPAPLEPCPTDFLLRPFWLMRCLFQTLVHPRGGYLSTKLFVPRDVWRVKGVKLKNVEDKIANCDYLTAVLQKLAKVDALDADALLEEMQALENTLEQVQASLSRKLGHDVGVQGSGLLFKEASMDSDGGSSAPRSGSVSGKASAFSWRRLRSKPSTVGLGGSYASRVSGSDGAKEAASMPTLPMTPKPTNRPVKRDLSLTQFIGPNAHYMGSLARLFDAAQAIDQIARQVEDPGLRHADKTQVGLELCTRHAAEFFGFFICRFVLADLGLLLDKFIKRGSEWVLN
ncbi:hypothetical protein PT974_03312 [Cladobotryum mycophilum]|uniref:MIT domain-containing protein n=1 Tax=Cladobotryum mycophilum TaxID=491253 RepID=A0ABR0SS38_9HYPO